MNLKNQEYYPLKSIIRIMKKTCLVAVLSLFIFACENEPVVLNNNSENPTDNPENPGGEMIFTSYHRLFPSGNTADYNFQEIICTDHFSNGELKGKYEYDTVGNMIKYTYYNSPTEIEDTYTFHYNDENVLVSVDEFHSNGPMEDTEYSRILERNGNTISIPFPDDNDSSLIHTSEYTFNDQGLLINSKQINYDGTTEVTIDYEYDANKNCIALFGTIGMLNQTIENVYDSKVNPLQSYFEAHYLNNIIIYGRSNGFGYSLAQVITTFGSNNRLSSSYPGYETSNTYLEYTYQNNYPVEVIAKSEFNDAILSTTEFLYE